MTLSSKIRRNLVPPIVAFYQPTSKHEPRHNDSSAPLEDPEENSRGFYAGSEKRDAATPEPSFHEGRDPVARLAHHRFLNRSPNGTFLASCRLRLGGFLTSQLRHREGDPGIRFNPFGLPQ